MRSMPCSSPVGRGIRFIAFIEQPEVIEQILIRLGLWPTPADSLCDCADSTSRSVVA